MTRRDFQFDRAVGSSTPLALAFFDLYPKTADMDGITLRLFAFSIYVRFFCYYVVRVSDYQPEDILEQFAIKAGYLERTKDDIYIGESVLAGMKFIEARDQEREALALEAFIWQDKHGMDKCNRERLVSAWCAAYRKRLNDAAT